VFRFLIVNYNVCFGIDGIGNNDVVSQETGVKVNGPVVKQLHMYSQMRVELLMFK